MAVDGYDSAESLKTQDYLNLHQQVKDPLLIKAYL